MLKDGLDSTAGCRQSVFGGELSPARARSWAALLALQTEDVNGVRPRDWNSDLAGLVLAIDPSAAEYPFCQLVACYRRLDEGAESLAVEHLERALARSARAGKPFRHAWFLEAACASANIAKKAAQARQWAERASKLAKPQSLDALEAAAPPLTASTAAGWRAAPSP